MRIYMSLRLSGHLFLSSCFISFSFLLLSLTHPASAIGVCKKWVYQGSQVSSNTNRNVSSSYPASRQSFLKRLPLLKHCYTAPSSGVLTLRSQRNPPHESHLWKETRWVDFPQFRWENTTITPHKSLGEGGLSYTCELCGEMGVAYKQQQHHTTPRITQRMDRIFTTFFHLMK